MHKHIEESWAYIDTDDFFLAINPKADLKALETLIKKLLEEMIAKETTVFLAVNPY